MIIDVQAQNINLDGNGRKINIDDTFILPTDWPVSIHTTLQSYQNDPAAQDILIKKVDSLITREIRNAADERSKRNYKKLTSEDGKLRIFLWDTFIFGDFICTWCGVSDIITENLVTYDQSSRSQVLSTNRTTEYKSINEITDKDLRRIYLLTYRKSEGENMRFGVQSFSFINGIFKPQKIFEIDGVLFDEYSYTYPASVVDKIGLIQDVIITETELSCPLLEGQSTIGFIRRKFDGEKYIVR